jgi:EmrB/QacA subfamily drug resistance transporter
MKLSKIKFMASNGNTKILLLLLIGVFMGSLDIGIVGPAFPAIQTYFGVNERLLSWVFTIYILFFMIGTPLMAKLSDIYGRKTIYMVNILLFGVGSILTVTAISFDMLLLGRAIQGVGAGGIFPVANAFIGDIFPPEKRGGALGILSSVWGLSGVLGPVLGALLLIYTWQWLFIINLPISLALLIASVYILPKSQRIKNIRFDWSGTIILGVLVASLSYGLNQIDTNNIKISLSSLSVWPFLALSIVLVPLLWKIEKIAHDPLIQINLLQSKEVKLVSSFMVGTGLVQAATIFIPSFVVVSLSYTSTNASLMLLPLVLTMALGAPIIGRLLDKFGSRNIMFFGSTIMVFGLFLVSLLPESFIIFIVSGIMIGIGMSTAIGSPPRYIMLLESPSKDRASGQALINIITSVGQLLGGAILGAIIGSYMDKTAGYEFSFLLIGAVAIIMALLTMGLKSKVEQLRTMKSNN